MAFTFQVNNDIRFLHDEALLAKSESFRPVIHKKTIKPVRLVELTSAPAKLNGAGVSDSSRELSRLSEYGFSRGQRIIIDFGRHIVGRFSVDISKTGSPQDAPLYVRFRFAEMPAELQAESTEYDGWLSRSWIQDEYIHVDELPARLELPRRYSFRYVEIRIIDTSPKWQAVFADTEAVSESSADYEALKRPEIHDELLGRIYDAGAATLAECMQDVFEDGPKRARRLWLGDLRLQALANYATFDNAALHPGAHEDPALVRELFPVCKRQMDLTLRMVDADGRLITDEKYPVFADWSNGFSKDTAGQAGTIYTLRQFIALAETAGDSEAVHYREVLGRMEDYSRTKLYDSSRRLFVSGNGEYNTASQVWMVLAHVMDDGVNAEILRTMIRELFPVKGIATPYMYHCIVEALCEGGLIGEAATLLKDYWGKMLELGADTFREAFAPDKPDYSPYGSPIVNSYCHAWSCTPVYIISRYLLK